MKKEILTTEKIKQDYKTIYLQQVKNKSVSLLFLLPLLIAFTLPIIFAPIEYKILCVIPCVLFAVSLYATLSMLFSYYKNQKSVMTEKFQILTDTLIDKYQEVPARRHQPEKPNVLIFSKCGKFILPECLNYSFSKNFYMLETELFRSSKINDEFYLILDSRKNILQVYNTKFFDI